MYLYICICKTLKSADHQEFDYIKMSMYMFVLQYNFKISWLPV